MNLDLIKKVLNDNYKNTNHEFKRLFHGRGNYYLGLSFLSIDSIDNILNVAFYEEIKEDEEKKMIDLLIDFIQNKRYKTINLQRRYLPKAPNQIIYGKLDDEIYAIENGIKFLIDLKSNQNNGYFPDMKNGREYITNISSNKRVLNLFSYTCGFSLASIIGNAKSVFNIDMSKGALSKGRANHHLNNFSTTNVQFGPYNILKSFSKIRKNAPYDIIIIDPPTFQKNSFEASKDYIKIIRRLEEVVSDNCTILACLNSPFLDENFIIDLFKENCSSFTFEKRLDNCKEFVCIDENKSLKNLIFKNFKN